MIHLCGENQSSKSFTEKRFVTVNFVFILSIMDYVQMSMEANFFDTCELNKNIKMTNFGQLD